VRGAVPDRRSRAAGQTLHGSHWAAVAALAGRQLLTAARRLPIRTSPGTVILLTAVTRRRRRGLVVNRRSEATLARVFPRC
jgi:hypothetical protein